MSGRIGILVLLLAVLLIPLHLLGVVQPVERLVVAGLVPVQRFLAAALPAPAAERATAERVAELERALATLTVENARLTALHRETKERETLAAFLDERTLRGVEASVIGRSTVGGGPFLVLDHGSERRVREGQPVITGEGAGEGIIVGTIARAEAGRSMVTLLTSADQRLAAEVQNESRSPGILTGQHGLTMTLTFIPQQEAVLTGQTVVTAPVDERIPANLVIGVVSDVTTNTGELFQEAAVRPLLDLERVRTVSVLVPS